MSKIMTDNERKGINITGLWLRTSDEGGVEVLIEIEGKWRMCIKDSLAGLTSHICEVEGMKRAPLDEVTK